MFPLDDFSEIIASRFKRHLRKLGVSPQRMKKLTYVAMNISPIQVVTRFELHVRIIQFKVSIRTREALDEFLTENVRYDFNVDKVAIIQTEKYKLSGSDLFSTNLYGV